jgi:catechol 2,3-dioxygenase-like lactoylglutathione lyase family enzyme
MKRFHVHLGVEDLERSVRFYAQLFGAEPVVRKHDYAKWMLDDPRVNFAISRRGAGAGANHLGVQVDSDAELAGVRAQFEAADAATTVAEPGASCCYAKSDKHWVTDPQGIAWEAFHTLGTIPTFAGESEPSAAEARCGPAIPESGTHADRAPAAVPSASANACCAPPSTEAANACCAPGPRRKATACCC